MSVTPGAGKAKKGGKGGKDLIEQFPPPPLDALPPLDERLVLEAALRNDYALVCGAFDGKDEHPVGAHIIANDLLNRRNEHGKCPFDLAASLGYARFIGALLERMPDKLNEVLLDVRAQLKPNRNAYNCLHYAVIWNRLDVCKLLVRQPRLVIDPAYEASVEVLLGTARLSKAEIAAIPTRTLGSCFLESRCTKTGESALELARRYGHADIIAFLEYAERRQAFVERVALIKATTTDVEKHMNKLSKDDKKRLEKLHAEMADWLEKSRESDDGVQLEAMIKATEETTRPILERLQQAIEEAARAASAKASLAAASARSSVAATPAAALASAR